MYTGWLNALVTQRNYLLLTLSMISIPFGILFGGSFSSAHVYDHSQSQEPKISPSLAIIMRLECIR